MRAKIQIVARMINQFERKHGSRLIRANVISLRCTRASHEDSYRVALHARWGSGSGCALSEKLKGVVCDPQGAVILSAVVLVHGDNHRSTGAGVDLRLTKDKRRESFRGVRILIGKTVNYESKLPLDPKIIAELGDSLVGDPEPGAPYPR